MSAEWQWSVEIAGVTSPENPRPATRVPLDSTRWHESAGRSRNSTTLRSPCGLIGWGWKAKSAAQRSGSLRRIRAMRSSSARCSRRCCAFPCGTRKVRRSVSRFRRFRISAAMRDRSHSAPPPTPDRTPKCASTGAEARPRFAAIRSCSRPSRRGLPQVFHTFREKFFSQCAELGHRVHRGKHAVLLRVLCGWAPCPLWLIPWFDSGVNFSGEAAHPGDGRRLAVWPRQRAEAPIRRTRGADVPAGALTRIFHTQTDSDPRPTSKISPLRRAFRVHAGQIKTARRF